jgi:hypothetical protein
MMDGVPINIIVGILAALVAGGATFLTTRWQLRKQFDFEYDRQLRERRLTAYEQLWRLLEVLSIYDRDPITVEEAWSLSAKLTRWYYRTGGLVLSTQARVAYFPLQNVASAAGHLPMPSEFRLDQQTMDDMKESASMLRTALTMDVGTRAGFLGRR